MFLIVRLLF